MKLKRLFKLIIIFVLIYIFFALFIYTQQRNIIYHPDSQDFFSCLAFDDYEAKVFNKTRFYFKEAGSNLIVHYHGNAGSACDRSFLKPYFEAHDFSIIFLEYAGYANDDRKASKELILNDVRNIVEFIEEKNFDKVFVFGESIGSGPASYQASISSVDSIVLVSPFYDLKSLAQSHYPFLPISILLKENYDIKKYLKNYNGNLLIFHGEKDLIISSKFSKKLYNELQNLNKKYILIKDASHNDIYSFNLFYEELYEFLKNK